MYRRNSNPLDLNNLPDDFTLEYHLLHMGPQQFTCIWDHSITKQPLEYHSFSAASGINKKKKNGGKDERGKVYECRFCSLKFGKSQEALGGHMNRHLQEWETETLKQARQLVFSSDNLATTSPHQLGGQATLHGGYHYPAGFNMGDATVYPTRLFSGSSTTMLPPQHPLSISISKLTDNDYFVDPYVSTNPQFRFRI